MVEGGEVAGQVGLVLRRARQQSPAQAGVIIEQVSWDWWRQGHVITILFSDWWRLGHNTHL